MLCPKCGSNNDDHSKFCLSCGGPLNQAVPTQTPAPPANPVPPYQAPYQPPAAPTKAKKGGKGCLIAVLVVFLVLVVAGVGIFFALSNKDDKDEKTTTDLTTSLSVTTTQVGDTTAVAEDASQPSADELQGILGGLGYGDWDGTWNNLTAEQKQALENYYAALGEDIRFTEDGLVFVDEDGNVITWGGKWPNSPLMKDVPKVDFGTIFTTTTDTDKVTILISNATEANFTDYVSKIKSAGFNNDPKEDIMSGVYSSFEASNSKGLRISVVMMAGLLTLTVSTDF